MLYSQLLSLTAFNLCKSRKLNDVAWPQIFLLPLQNLEH